MKRTWFCALVLASGGAAAREDSGAPRITVASKSFTESVILGEVVAQMARWAGARVDHRRELGGTKLLWSALLAGDVDVYPEDAGATAEEILGKPGIRGDEAIRNALAERGVIVSGSLGFNNAYAIGMRQAVADRLGIRTISDLARHPELRLGFSNEFIDR